MFGVVLLSQAINNFSKRKNLRNWITNIHSILSIISYVFSYIVFKIYILGATHGLEDFYRVVPLRVSNWNFVREITGWSFLSCFFIQISSGILVLFGARHRKQRTNPVDLSNAS
jgi:hypothetical protein